MTASPTNLPHVTRCSDLESRDALPKEVALLLAASATEADAAWSAFLAAYSPLLLRVASAFGPGYDGALDRYAFMLDELRRNDFRRIGRFAADGRSRFSTWLAVVARRLCLDHHRLRYGRFRGDPAERGGFQGRRATRRRLTEFASAADDPDRMADTALSDPTEQLDANHRNAALAGALGTLSPTDRLLIRLRFEEDLTAREIAERLGLPTPFHVYRRLATICARLRPFVIPRGVRLPA